MTKPKSLVPTLEQCRELAKHVELETYFKWLDTGQEVFTPDWQGKYKGREVEQIPAPTVSELREVMPNVIDGFRLSIHKEMTDFYRAVYRRDWVDERPAYDSAGKTPSQALCSLLIHLLEEEVITVDELKT